MTSSSEDESLESSVPANSYLPGRLDVGINITPLPSPESSPKVPEQATVEMGDEDAVLKDLKQIRTTAKARYTVLKKAILGLLENPDVPASRATASEKEFQTAFKKLNDAHCQYVGAKYLDEEEQEPQDAAYMDTPVTERLEVDAEWAKWHNAHERALQEAHHVNREEAQ